MGTAKKPIRPPPERFLPTGVQKSYFMLSDAERTVLNKALEKYQPGRSEPIFVGGHKVLKPALRLMTLYRLAIDEIQDGQAVTRYTRWIDAVEVRGAQEQEVYLTFQSAVRTYLAGIQEASTRVCRPEAGQYWTAQPVCPTALRLGERPPLRNQAHYVGATSHGAGAGFG
jgi:hypothetical protein